MQIRKNKQLWLIVAGVAVLLLAGLAVFYSSNRKGMAVSAVTPQPTPSASTSASSAPATSTTPTPEIPSKFSPTPTPTPVSGVVVNIDSITPRADGTLKIANTVLGTSTGTCKLEIIDPDQQKTSFAGTIETNGPAFFCSLEAITGVTKSGSWTAKLTASANGASGSSSKDFTK